MISEKQLEQNRLFFSIIIPAHNEEKYIENTLKKIINLDYPKDKVEVFVIENGSNDKTLEVAQKLSGQNISVLISPEKGVSIARNLGTEKVSKNSDWVIFLDADTLLERNFLKELNIFLQKNSNKNYSIGTTSIMPFPETKKAKRWFVFWDLGHKIFKASYAIQIIKRSLLADIRYDVNLEMGEDLKLIKEARRYGKFFFFETKDVLSSTRRFEQVGWWKLFFQWIFIAKLPKFLQKKFTYKVTR